VAPTAPPHPHNNAPTPTPRRRRQQPRAAKKHDTSGATSGTASGSTHDVPTPPRGGDGKRPIGLAQRGLPSPHRRRDVTAAAPWPGFARQGRTPAPGRRSPRRPLSPPDHSRLCASGWQRQLQRPCPLDEPTRISNDGDPRPRPRGLRPRPCDDATHDAAVTYRASCARTPARLEVTALLRCSVAPSAPPPNSTESDAQPEEASARTTSSATRAARRGTPGASVSTLPLHRRGRQRPRRGDVDNRPPIRAAKPSPNGDTPTSASVAAAATDYAAPRGGALDTAARGAAHGAASSSTTAVPTRAPVAAKAITTRPRPRRGPRHGCTVAPPTPPPPTPTATTTTSHSAPRIEAPDVIPNGAANGSA